MEKIDELLKEIIIEKLEECKKQKEVPSKEVLDTIDKLRVLIY